MIGLIPALVLGAWCYNDTTVQDGSKHCVENKTVYWDLGQQIEMSQKDYLTLEWRGGIQESTMGNPQFDHAPTPRPCGGTDPNFITLENCTQPGPEGVVALLHPSNPYIQIGPPGFSFEAPMSKEVAHLTSDGDLWISHDATPEQVTEALTEYFKLKHKEK